MDNHTTSNGTVAVCTRCTAVAPSSAKTKTELVSPPCTSCTAKARWWVVLSSTIKMCKGCARAGLAVDTTGLAGADEVPAFPLFTPPDKTLAAGPVPAGNVRLENAGDGGTMNGMGRAGDGAEDTDEAGDEPVPLPGEAFVKALAAETRAEEEEADG